MYANSRFPTEYNMMCESAYKLSKILISAENAISSVSAKRVFSITKSYLFSPKEWKTFV